MLNHTNTNFVIHHSVLINPVIFKHCIKQTQRYKEFYGKYEDQFTVVIVMQGEE